MTTALLQTMCEQLPTARGTRFIVGCPLLSRDAYAINDRLGVALLGEGIVDRIAQRFGSMQDKGRVYMLMGVQLEPWGTEPDHPLIARHALCVKIAPGQEVVL
ncbi:MAG: hypothetical protein V4617_15145 [Gemmatimonadota bacterium]